MLSVIIEINLWQETILHGWDNLILMRRSSLTVRLWFFTMVHHWFMNHRYIFSTESCNNINRTSFISNRSLRLLGGCSIRINSFCHMITLWIILSWGTGRWNRENTIIHMALKSWTPLKKVIKILKVISASQNSMLAVWEGPMNSLLYFWSTKFSFQHLTPTSYWQPPHN